MLEQTSIFTELKKDHDHHRNMLSQINASIANPDLCRQLFTNFALDVKAHALAEEQALYAALLKKPAFTEDTRHSVAEHKEIDDLINTLAEQNTQDGEWLKQFTFLEKRYLHHISEEEEELFIKARNELSLSEQMAMGEVFDKRKPIEKSSATLGEEE